MDNKIKIHAYRLPIWQVKWIAMFLNLTNKNFKHSIFKWQAKARGIKNANSILLFGNKYRSKLLRLGKPLVTVEDGFIRSTGLGILPLRYFMSFGMLGKIGGAPPLSLVFDKTGIYFDATQPSDLENIFKKISLDNQQLARIRKIIKTINRFDLTKYNSEPSKSLTINTDKRVILVPGQVEDDASIKYGSKNIQTNLELLTCVRNSNPEAYIIYKPHPDVTNKLRKHSKLAHLKCIEIADEVVSDINIISCIKACDEVHTMTSLSGFDALLRNKKVVTYGMPFYAGWGLTEDHLICPRRNRKLTLEELAYGALIEYPVYYDIEHKKPIDLEQAIEIILYKLGKSSIAVIENGIELS